MKWLAIFVIPVVLFSSLCPSHANDRAWMLGQNVPDPFCHRIEATQIPYDLDEDCHVCLEIKNVEGTEIVRTLVDGLFEAGSHYAIWDGRDDGGEYVESNGDYPYVLTAREGPDGEVLFTDTLIAHVECQNPVEPTTWGAVKAAYKH